MNRQQTITVVCICAHPLPKDWPQWMPVNAPWLCKCGGWKS